jgi:hypothetical protein
MSAGDNYRAKALELLARAEIENDLTIRAEFENLAAAFALRSRPSATLRLLSSSNFLPKRVVTQNVSGSPSCDLFHFKANGRRLLLTQSGHSI